MGKHKPRKTKISDLCRTVSQREFLKFLKKARKAKKNA